MIQRPSSLDQLTETFAQLHQMRQVHPVYYDEATVSWHLFGYQEVEQVLTDVHHFASPGLQHGAFPHVLRHRHTDLQHHALLRKMITRALPPRAVNQLALLFNHVPNAFWINIA